MHGIVAYTMLGTGPKRSSANMAAGTLVTEPHLSVDRWWPLLVTLLVVALLAVAATTPPQPRRIVQIPLGHAKIESTVRYLGVDVEDALALSEKTEI